MVNRAQLVRSQRAWLPFLQNVPVPSAADIKPIKTSWEKECFEVAELEELERQFRDRKDVKEGMKER